MASTKLTPAAKNALTWVMKGKSFVLDGGAGSGKTHALTLLVDAVLGLGLEYRIACITYTNAAADEIRDRYQSSRLSVSTIHDFLWSYVNGFQRELRDCLLRLIRDGQGDKLFALPDPKMDVEDAIGRIPDKIEYRNVPRLLDGIVSHDQMIALSCKMISAYPKLARLIADEFPVILVDEYQDTSPLVADTLLDAVAKDHKCVVGFFGDHMQAIYDDGVGSLLPRVQSTKLKQVTINENRRNSRAVLDLANKLRFDFAQLPSSDADAPNMKNGELVKGDVHIVVGDDSDGMRRIRKSRLCAEWVGDVQETWLTRRAVASEVGYQKLHELHRGKDPVLKYAKAIVEACPEVKSSEEPFEVVAFQWPLEFKRKQKGFASRLEKLKGESPESYESACGLPFGGLFAHQLTDDNLHANAGTDGMGQGWCPVLRHACQLYWIINAHESGDYRSLCDLIPVTISSISDKKRLSETIEGITDLGPSSLGDALRLALDGGLMRVGDDLARFEKEHGYVYGRLLLIPLAEYYAFFSHYFEKGQFSTQHKTKGLEYRNEIVSLSNGRWNKYDFQKVFSMTPAELKDELTKESPNTVIARSAKLLYVSTTRAMENLILYLDTGKANFNREALRAWFDENQIVDINELEPLK